MSPYSIDGQSHGSFSQGVDSSEIGQNFIPTASSFNLYRALASSLKVSIYFKVVIINVKLNLIDFTNKIKLAQCNVHNVNKFVFTERINYSNEITGNDVV
jgi:hypothetical protein